MAVTTRRIADSAVEPVKQHATRFRKFARDYFGVQPLVAPAAGGYGAAPTLTTGAVNVMLTPNALYEWVVLGGGQTLTPLFSSSGLEVGLDATDDEGVEITNGITALSPAAFVVGTDRAFYCKAQFKIADASVDDTFYFGFRKVQAYQTAVASTYTDYACLGFNASATAAAIKIMTDNDNAGETETDTTMTWADAATKTLEVRVFEDCYVKFLINGAQPTVTRTSFAFDSGDTVIPFFFHLRGSTAANAIHLLLWEYGYLPRRAE